MGIFDLQPLGVYSCHMPHVMADFMVNGLNDVLSCGLGLSVGFVIKPEVEVSVKQLLVEGRG